MKLFKNKLLIAVPSKLRPKELSLFLKRYSTLPYPIIIAVEKQEWFMYEFLSKKIFVY